jgi:hypothetical protein
MTGCLGLSHCHGLLLRVVITTQATVCTSLLAALPVERRRVSISIFARLLLLGSVKEGPLDLLHELVSFRHKPIANLLIENGSFGRSFLCPLPDRGLM